MSKKLTAEYIKMRTKCDRLEGIKNLNLWGCDLEDISIVKDLGNLEVVSLSINRIKQLKFFANLKFLRELYIRKNMISDISEVLYLKKCNNLRTLWLNENPLADSKNYRNYVIKNLPQIIKLDDVPITAEERNYANNLNLDDLENSEEEENYFDNKNINISEKNKNNEEPINENHNYSGDENKNDNLIQNNFQNNKNLNEKPEFKIYKNNNNNENKQYYRQHSENLNNYKVEKSDRHHSQIVNKNNKLDEIEYVSQKKSLKSPILKENNDDYQNKKSNQNINNEKGTNIKKETVMNCVMMLIKELSIDDIEQIKKELDKKIKNYYNDS